MLSKSVAVGLVILTISWMSAIADNAVPNATAPCKYYVCFNENFYENNKIKMNNYCVCFLCVMYLTGTFHYLLSA